MSNGNMKQQLGFGWLKALVLAALAGVLSAALPTSLSAQDVLTPYVYDGYAVLSQEDLDVLKGKAVLSNEQAQGMKLLYDGYDAARADTNKRTHRAQETIDLKGEWQTNAAAEAKMQATISRQRTELAALEQAFVLDLLSLLSAEQRTLAWPTFERKRRIRVLMPLVQRPLITCFLPTIVEEVMKAPLALPAETAEADNSAGAKTATADTAKDQTASSDAQTNQEKPVDATLSPQLLEIFQQYEDEVDAALLARRGVGFSHSRYEDSESRKSFEEQSRQHEAVRNADKRMFDIQIRFLNNVYGAVAPDRAAAIEKRVQADFFEFIYRPTRRLRRMQEVPKVLGVLPEQVVAMTNIIEEAQQKVAMLQNRFFDEWYRSEFRRTLREEEDGENFPNWHAFRNQRREVEGGGLNRLLSLLTAEQRKAYEEGVFREKKKGEGDDGEADD